MTMQNPTDRPTTLAVRDHAPLTVRMPDEFGEEHRAIVKEAYAPGASDVEFDVLWRGAKSRGLDPIKKQIHFVSRYDPAKDKNVWSSQVAIDGFRSIAEATGLYDGQDEPTFTRDPVSGGVTEARVRVYRKDISRPFVGVALWDEFVQTKKNGDPTYMWMKMPHHMLAKCAEALALRKAFPEQLSGLYSDDEMPEEKSAGGRTVDAQIEPEARDAIPSPPPRPAWAQDIFGAVKTGWKVSEMVLRAVEATAEATPAEVEPVLVEAMTWGRVAEASQARAVEDWRKRVEARNAGGAS
jgi:phage recombination protein Bet